MMTVNAEVVSVKPTDDGLNTVVSLIANAGEFWVKPYKSLLTGQDGAFNYPRIDSETEGNILQVKIDLIAEGVDDPIIEVGTTVIFTAHFDRIERNIEVAPTTETPTAESEVA